MPHCIPLERGGGGGGGGGFWIPAGVDRSRKFGGVGPD